MSRCFPFPPPGYELKGRLDDANLIIKEKEKSKKHKDKKEKKERSERKEKVRGEDKHREDKEDKKEKKEKSERKDKKERSEEKHREDKKRKREKHRDKKDKKKDKQGSSGETEEKRSVGSLENQNGPKLVLDSKQPTHGDGLKEERTLVELGNRVKSDGATSIRMVQKITIVEKDKANFSERVQENGNGMLANNGMVQKITIVEKDKANFSERVQENGNGMLANNGKRDRSFMANGQNFQFDSRSLGNGRNSYGENQIKIDEGKSRNGINGYKNIVGEGDVSKIEEQNKKGKEKKELTEFRKETVKQTSNGNFLDFHSNIPRDLLKVNNESQGKLPKLKELNGFLHAKDNGVRPNNMLRPAHQAAQIGVDIGPSRKRAISTDPKVNGKLSSPQSVIDNVRNIKTENGGVDHRVLSNGIISPHIIRVERKMEPCQTSNAVSMAKQIINSNSNGKAPLAENGEKMTMQMPNESRMDSSLDGKEHSLLLKRKEREESRMDSSLDGKEHSRLLKRKEREEKKDRKEKEKKDRKEKKERKENAAVTKPPHPDLEYLSQILTVPEVGLPQHDEQEWLFESRHLEKTRLKIGSPEIQPRKEVWSEAVHLESADVTALPYVIPY